MINETVFARLYYCTLIRLEGTEEKYEKTSISEVIYPSDLSCTGQLPDPKEDH
jgi:hypothetical protein